MVVAKHLRSSWLLFPSPHLHLSGQMFAFKGWKPVKLRQRKHHNLEGPVLLQRWVVKNRWAGRCMRRHAEKATRRGWMWNEAQSGWQISTAPWDNLSNYSAAIWLPIKSILLPLLLLLLMIVVPYTRYAFCDCFRSGALVIERCSEKLSADESTYKRRTGEDYRSGWLFVLDN